MKAIKRAYSTSGGGVDMESMQELFYGSIEEREALANAITNKGVDTNVSDTLSTMAENVNNIEMPKIQIDKLWFHRYGQMTNITGLTKFKKFSWTSISLSNAKNPVLALYDAAGVVIGSSMTMSASGGYIDITNAEKIYIYAQDNNSTSQQTSINGVVIE